MGLKVQEHRRLKKEIPVETIVAGMRASTGTLRGLKERLSLEEVSNLASSFRRLKRLGKGIILRCQETFPYMIPVLSEVDGIVSPKNTATTKGHSAEFCREEGKIFVVADEPAWRELDDYEGVSILVDPRSRKIILHPDSQATQKANAGYVPQSEIKVIGELIKEGRHISLLSTAPEHIIFSGNFSYFCRQEQLLMSKGKSPWELLRQNKEQCEQTLYTVWNEYTSKIQSGILTVFRSHDARSDEYPGSPIPHEPNPQLGNHGPSLFESFPHLLQAEVAAITKVKAENLNKKIAYLLPFVRSKHEIHSARQALSHALAITSLPEDAVELAVMYETPALPYLVDELHAADVRTIWIGTKDLLMSFLMVDRDNPTRHLQDYLLLLNYKGKPNLAFIRYLSENIKRFYDAGFEVVMYTLASEVPIFAKYLPKQVGFLLSKGSVKQSLSCLEV